jgi:hypothetical protein
VRQPWKAVRWVIVGLLLAIIVLTVVSGTVGIHWTRSSGGNGIRLYERHDAKTPPLVAVVAVAVELGALTMAWRWGRARRS